MSVQILKMGYSPKTYREVSPVMPYQWARIKHQARTVPQILAPDEIILQDKSYTSPIDQLGAGIPWLAWWKHFDEINNAPARAWMRHYESMLFNNDETGGEIDTTQKINIRCTDGGGNLFAYDKETTHYVRMVCYPFDYTVSSLTTNDNFFNPATQHLYFYPTAINKDGKVFKIGSGLDIYIPRVAREKWILKSKCMFFMGRPPHWTIEDVLAP